MRSLAIDSSLEGIAGPPSVMFGRGSDGWAWEPIGIPIQPFEDRIMYAAYRITKAPTSSYVHIGMLRYDTQESHGTFGFQTNQANTESNVRLVSQNNGNPNVTTLPNIANSQQIGFHILWAQQTDGQSKITAGSDSNPIGSSSNLVSGNGFEARMALKTNSGNDFLTRECFVAYRGSHDLATRERILNWLMQRYGNL